MKKVILKCRPGARFHLGKAVSDPSLQMNDTSEYIHSDTLYSALINAFKKVNPDEVEKLVKAFGDEAIKISSVFYCIEPLNGSPWLFFLPVPVSLPNLIPDRYKQAKKVNWVSEKMLSDSSSNPQNWLEDNTYQVIDGKLICYEQELDFLEPNKRNILSVYSKKAEPKVKVRTLTSEDAFFERTDLHLESHPKLINDLNCHFWFGLTTKDQEAENLVEKGLSLLVEEGIGGERSQGCGQLENYEFQDWNNFEEEGQNSFMNLSLTVPGSKAAFDKFRYYELLKRGGQYISRSKKDDTLNHAKQVQMIKEGGLTKLKPEGCTVNLVSEQERQPVNRYGRCFTIPVSHKFFPHEF